MPWYDNTPTVWANEGITTFINCTDDMLPNDAGARPWMNRAKANGHFPFVVTRAAVPKLLEGVAQADIDAAKLTPNIFDVSMPTTGTQAQKEAALENKLRTPIPVSDWDKIIALRATVAAKEG